MNKPSYINICINLTQSFLSTWALMKAGRMEPGNILTIVFFLLCMFFYQRIDERLQQTPLCNNKTSSRTATAMAVLYTVLYMAIDYSNYIDTLTNPIFCIGILSVVFVGFYILFYRLILLLFSYTGNKNWVSFFLYGSQTSDRTDISFYQRHTGLICFFLCILGWLPYFLYQYPGIMTPDSVNQFEQALGMIPYSNHHPFVRTLLLKLLYTIGYTLTGSRLIGISFYTFFQMCLLAFAASYFVSTLRYFGIRSHICLAFSLLYALVPYHAVFSITLWKDIPFAAAVLLFTTALLRFRKKIIPKDLTIFLFSGIMLCLFRSNGWYGFLLSFPFLLIYFKKQAKTFFPVLGFILFTAIIIKYPVMNHLQVTQPDFVESISIPLQQVSAVICNDRPLSEEELSLIENVMDLTYIKILYHPTFADNIKELVRAGHPEYLEAHKKEFFILWLKLGLRYPGDYLTAYIDQTHGYWYPDAFYLVAEAEGISATHLGVSHTPLIRGPLVVKTKEIAIKLGSMLPIYGTLWSMGVAFWILIFCIGNCIIRREKSKLIFYLPGIALILTVLIATPVATEFRYVYFLIFSLPLYLIISLIPLPDSEDMHTT